MRTLSLGHFFYFAAVRFANDSDGAAFRRVALLT